MEISDVYAQSALKLLGCGKFGYFFLGDGPVMNAWEKVHLFGGYLQSAKIYFLASASKCY